MAAVADHGQNLVLPADRLGDVVGRIQGRFAVIGRRRIEDLIAHPAAVDEDLMNAQAADIEAGLADVFARGEGLPEINAVSLDVIAAISA